jgi:hypothetical protein
VQETLARPPQQAEAEAEAGREWVSDRLSLERFSETVFGYYDAAFAGRGGSSS